MEDQQEATELESTDILTKLPIEVAEHILSFLTAEELAKASLVCKAWNEIANSDFLWKAICTQKEIPDEILVADLSAKILKSRWASVHHAFTRRSTKWSVDGFTWMKPRNIYTAGHIEGSIMALTNRETNSVFLYYISDDTFHRFQKFDVTAIISSFMFSSNTIVLNGLSSLFVFVYTQPQNLFEREAIIVPSRDLVLSYYTDFVEDPEKKFLKTSVITSSFIWISCLDNCKIYNRKTKTLKTLELTDADFEYNNGYVVALKISCILIFTESGEELHKFNDFSYYRGLVISTNGIAFLQSADFCNPEAVYYNFHTKSSILENRFKVYKLSLYKENLFFLAGQNEFTIISKRKNEVLWTTDLQGSKYLRPGKDFFKIICSKFIFVGPSLGRLDMFSLYDLQTGRLMYNTCLSISSYNIIQVSNTGIIVKTSDAGISFRSYA